MMNFLNDLDEFIKIYEKERKMTVMSDINTEVGCDRMDQAVGKWKVPGRNEK